MIFFGTVAYDWHGTARTALAAPHARSVTPDVVVELRDEWVQVGRVTGGTELVAWDSVRELRGWAPVPEEDRR